MPTYKFKNTETGEIFEKFMPMADREKYLEENPNLKQLINMSSDNFVSEVGEGWRGKLGKKHPDWKYVLDTVKKVPGATTDVSHLT